MVDWMPGQKVAEEKRVKRSVMGSILCALYSVRDIQVTWIFLREMVV